GGLSHNGYIIYPEDYKYYTTSASVTLSFSSDTARHVDFKQHISLGTITPYDLSGVASISMNDGFSIYPNPASGVLNLKWTGQASCDADVTVTDMLGRAVYKTI